MTSREEIERLLNQTGRTLKRLPELYPIEQCEDAIRRSGVSVGMAGNMICHQSDVIELLVGALRDALDKPKHKPMTLEELTKSAYQIPCWIEGIGKEEMDADVLDRDSLGLFAKLASSGTGFAIRCDMSGYGITWRAWATRPTDEERSAAAWES